MKPKRCRLNAGKMLAVGILGFSALWLISSEAVRADTSFTDLYQCGRFKIKLTGNTITNQYSYQTRGLTLTDGVYERAQSTYNFKHGSYIYSLQNQGDGTGKLEVTKTLSNGHQSIQIREKCQIKSP